MVDGVSAEELRQFYAGKQFEFGWASLCRMILPDNLEGMTILDVGCRRGKGVFKLSDRVGENGTAIGIDWAAPYIEEARQKCDQAWRDTGLPRNNMAFAVGFPEDLEAAGIQDNSMDVVYINSVMNIAYDPQVALAECARVLKPGGLLVLEAVTANKPREMDVVRQAREIGNTVQAAPFEEDLRRWLEFSDLSVEKVFEEHPVFVDTGYRRDYKAQAIDSDEEVSFTAAVFHARKER